MLFFPVISVASGCVCPSRVRSDGWVHKPSETVDGHQPYGGGYLQCKVNLRHRSFQGLCWCCLTCNRVWHTFRESSPTAFGFITGRRRQTAASCKESCIWDGKALLAAPCLSLPCMESLQCLHRHLPSHLCPARLGCGTAGTGIELVSLPAPRAASGLLSPPPGPHIHTRDLTCDSEQATKSCICLQASTSGTVVCSLSMSFYFLVLFPWPCLSLSSVSLQKSKPVHSIPWCSKTFLASAKCLSAFSVCLRRRCEPSGAEI